MRSRSLRGFLVAITALTIAGLVAPALSAQAERPRILAVELDNDINPVKQEFLENAVDRAEDEEFDAVVVVLDTPGGLSSSMRALVQGLPPLGE